MDVTLEGDPNDTVTLPRELAEWLYAQANTRLAAYGYPAHLADTLERARDAIRGTAKVPTPLLPHRVNTASLITLAAEHDGQVHGEDGSLVWNVEFPSIREAAAFQRAAGLRFAWTCNLRGTVEDFSSTCTVQVRAAGTSQAFPGALEMAE